MSDFTLYKISQDFENLVDLIDRDVLEDWELEELQKRISTAISSQGKDIVKYYVNQMAEIEALKNEIERLKVIKSSKEASITRLKEKLTSNMRTLRCPKITTPLGNITLSLDGVIESVEVDEDVDIETIPEQYVKVSKEVKKAEIKKALKDGSTFNGVRLKTEPAKVVFRLGQESKEYIENANKE